MIYRKLGKYAQITVPLGETANSLDRLVKLRKGTKRNNIVRAALRYGLVQMRSEIDSMEGIKMEGIKK